MVFRSKVDQFFINIICISIIITGIAILWPILFDPEMTDGILLMLLSIFIVTTGFIVWVSFDIKYTMFEDYLLVKAGPVRSKISYEEITLITTTKDIFTGYRLLSSRDALEVFYKSGWMGSVKISPEDKQSFISEIKKRSPDVKVNISDGYNRRD
ncbi:hypothetical protein E3U55_05475 [Filobacillus milosensis]|uniref:Uncharacterized protein YyaB-like PH domain-containing protein n=1 Tax=Filobacillus milosensis TaxID=94137 RepID=A0A4Y8IRG9_9BACI|nr:PH domain-containing protein [Filobacillus milosensis]TFB23268.1 hypothetical protein E3U55_05475 [Filobacillus milosensis]